MNLKIYKINLYNKLKFRAFLLILALFIISLLARVEKTQSRNSFPVAGEREPIKTIKVTATAYSSDVGQTDDTPCIPADGYDLCAHYEKYGQGNTIAANFLPLGTLVRIPELYGDKIFVVHDRMNSRYGYGRVDVWMPSRDEAKTFGVKYFEIEIYGAQKWKMASK